MLSSDAYVEQVVLVLAPVSVRRWWSLPIGIVVLVY